MRDDAASSFALCRYVERCRQSVRDCLRRCLARRVNGFSFSHFLPSERYFPALERTSLTQPALGSSAAFPSLPPSVTNTNLPAAVCVRHVIERDRDESESERADNTGISSLGWIRQQVWRRRRRRRKRSKGKEGRKEGAVAVTE